ncbi:hypothetical protein ABT390_06465 [Streptomyces aurantiacus]|uniref:Uncharacterized protein n=1 Tax=Streptomyces aurantiacus JA 4570 TaxID=1286094 RepID=S3Z913_9ACTN|nr:hypothetical protein [Streptomyces aurantiacus]EPH40196.1 hypothetical protein STRAU_6749 [Streptomyces aurantiacus JA 4570]
MAAQSLRDVRIVSLRDARVVRTAARPAPAHVPPMDRPKEPKP